MPELLLLDRQSRNALKHGGRSLLTLLDHEDPKEWAQMLDRYLDEYKPETVFLEELVLEAAQAHWLFKRTQTDLKNTQTALPPNTREWTAEDQHQITMLSRSQTTAERSYQRALAKLQSYQRQEQGPAKEVKGAEAKASDKKPKESKPVIVEQWVEIRNVNNQIVAEFSPTNDELAAEIEQKKIKPTLLYRRLNFPDGVPGKYEWTRPRKGMATLGGMCVQRMTMETWEKLREIERETGLAERTGLATLRDWRDV